MTYSQDGVIGYSGMALPYRRRLRPVRCLSKKAGFIYLLFCTYSDRSGSISNHERPPTVQCPDEPMTPYPYHCRHSCMCRERSVDRFTFTISMVAFAVVDIFVQQCPSRSGKLTKLGTKSMGPLEWRQLKMPLDGNLSWSCR